MIDHNGRGRLIERTVPQQLFGFSAAKFAEVIFLVLDLGHYTEGNLVRLIEVSWIKDERDKDSIFLDKGCARLGRKIIILSAGNNQGSSNAPGIENRIDCSTLFKICTNRRQRML